jgi:hypothetical protein
MSPSSAGTQQQLATPRTRRANAVRRKELRAWKEEHGVSPDTKVFVLDPPTKNPQGDLAVQQYLEALGWHYNTATEPPNSLFFDLRFQRLRRRSSRDRLKPGGAEAATPSSSSSSDDDDDDDEKEEEEEDSEDEGSPRLADLGLPGGQMLAPFQSTNHYTHTGCVTSKTGLVRTLADCRFLGDLDPDHFAPRAYCISSCARLPSLRAVPP